MTTARQPGWYDDSDDPNAQRYWDGQDWTPHRQRKPLSQRTQAPGGGWGGSGAPAQDADYPRKRRPWWLVILCLIGALLLLLLLFVFGFFNVGNKIFRAHPSGPGLAGPGTSAPATPGAPGTSAAAAPPGSSSHTPGSVRVIIDGQEKSVQGTLWCATRQDGKFAIGTNKTFENFAVVLTPGAPLVVDSVVFPQGPPSNPSGGLAGLGMEFSKGISIGEASAVKDGNSYTIKGTAADAAHSYQTTRPFEIDATCPS